MSSLTEQVLNFVESQPEGTPISAKGLLHLSNRAAVDQTLSRLAKSGEITRLERGSYIRPVQTKFGSRAPDSEKLIEQLGARGETIVTSGGAAANALGLTTQVPVREVYLTSGRSRHLSLGGKREIELRHAKRWQLLNRHNRAGEAVRALEWLGPQHVQKALTTLRSKLHPAEVKEIEAMRPALPGWLAQEISATVPVYG